MSEKSSYTSEDILRAARDWLGTPYRHQASCKGAGVDCLGLVRGLYLELEGVEPEVPPAYTPDWAEIPGSLLGEAEPMLAAARRHLNERKIDEGEPGDILIFRMKEGAAAKHAALKSDGNCMIHAYAGRAVAEGHMGHWWQRRLVAIFRFPGKR